MTKEKRVALLTRLNGAALVALTLVPADAFANNFSKISKNISTSISSVPGLLSVLAYLMGLVLGILGVLKIKDHVENPTQTPLKDGAIRLAVGGALFALPILFESMLNTIGKGGVVVGSGKVKKAKFNLQ